MPRKAKLLRIQVGDRSQMHCCIRGLRTQKRSAREGDAGYRSIVQLWRALGGASQVLRPSVPPGNLLELGHSFAGRMPAHTYQRTGGDFPAFAY